MVFVMIINKKAALQGGFVWNNDPINMLRNLAYQ